MSALTKARKLTDQDALDAQLARQEKQILTAIASFIRDMNSPQMRRVFRQHMQDRNIGGAMNLIDRYIQSMSNVIPTCFVEAAGVAAASFDDKLPDTLKKADDPIPFRVGVGFDPSQPRAASIIRQAKLRFVQQFSDSQRAVTRAVLSEALQEGGSTLEAARALQDSIGLTEHQQAAVESYRAALERGSKAALDRVLRDRRFDRSVEGATPDDPLTPGQIERMTERYRERMVAYRAETIARTEALSVLSEANYEATEQMIEQTGIDRSRVRRRWHATKDKRTRDSHRPMDGQEVGMDEPFESGAGVELWWPGDVNAPAEERIACRCTTSVHILPPE